MANDGSQEWHLHPHVEVRRVLVESSLNAVAKDHPAVRVTTRVSRRFRFFFWNFALTLVRRSDSHLYSHLYSHSHSYSHSLCYEYRTSAPS